MKKQEYINNRYCQTGRGEYRQRYGRRKSNAEYKEW